jgi:adenine-specific DNA-methyltransferase
MDKMKMHTVDITEGNIEKIGQLFPNCLTERVGNDGKVEKAIDFDLLRQELSKGIVEGTQERYQFSWPDKKRSIRLANAPSSKTLRPYRKESVSFDSTENLYIEGDNLEVLKLLRETYLGKIKVIYIDPPYNTGSDFVYEDDFSQTTSEYIGTSGQTDAFGNRLVQNTETNGRFHTDWLNMMFPRIKIARDLLSEDGVIFISIDDYEQENLKKICDEVFGSSNFISQVVWERSFAPISLKKHFSNSHDYILVYGKNISITECHGLPRTEENSARYSNPDNDPRGPWQSDNTTVGPVVQSKVYELQLPSGRKILPPSGRCWLYTKERFEEMIADNRIWFGADGDNVPRLKRFLSEVKQGITPMSIWKHEEVGHSQSASQNLKKLFDGKAYFEYPKPVDLIERCIALYSEKDSIIMDFFSGSATTAHAVFKRNAEDGGNRRFIMVQLPEETSPNSEAFRDGYKTICDIGKERIKRAGKKVLEEKAQQNNVGGLFAQADESAKIDVGFRVLKLDSSNMEDVYYKPEDSSEATLFEDNVKPDRTGEDLLFQVMLECNLPLSAKIKTEKIAGKEVFSVNNGYLIACFDEDVNEKVITEVAKRKPYYFIMRDKSLSSDNVADNFEQIFQAYSKDTIRRIL